MPFLAARVLYIYTYTVIIVEDCQGGCYISISKSWRNELHDENKIYYKFYVIKYITFIYKAVLSTSLVA